MEYEERYRAFEQYLVSWETGVEERARNWSMAIGLQDVDRLKPSEFLLEQAMNNNYFLYLTFLLIRDHYGEEV